MAAANSDQTQWHIFTCDEQEFRVPIRYQDPKKIGHGAFGAVVQMTDTVTGKSVAIKRLIQPFRGTEHAKRAYRELKLLMHLNHPGVHIVRLLNVFTPDNKLREFQTFYLVMKYAGVDLNRIIRKHKFTEDHIKQIIYSILRALKFAHSAEILHRDLKPSNIGIDEDSNLTILDFGLGRVAADGDQTGYVQTRWWRAPDVYANWQRYDDKLDTWSVGCIMGELILRKPIFPGTDQTDHLKKIFEMIGTPDMSTLKEICTPDVAEFISQMPRQVGKNLNELFGYKYAAENPQPISGISPVGVDLLRHLLTFNHLDRPTAAEALAHPFLADFHDPMDEPTLNPLVDEHQNARHNVENWKSIIWELIQRFEEPVVVDDDDDDDMDDDS
ncbi:unnamed protein product [Adineta ricciae]|uniref:mitogen-activated protein kinase n=1 Tax=Adineta ricciae TaxID=249248 RepID=A0A813P417_ADIRI|nr:unnamed protein product [Adineta ricciae]CAF0757753.1 unnamed protein product [Adineta ricciae]